MEIGLIHLTDLHLESETDIKDKIESLCSVIKNDLSVADKKYLVISGDIVNHGKAKQYAKAKKIFQKILKDCNIDKLIIAPGNHDCNFDYDDQIRRNSINNIDYNTLGDDGSVIEQAIKVQKLEMWEVVLIYQFQYFIIL